MAKALTPRTIRLGVAGALVGALSCGCAGLLSALPGCSDRNERFAATLADLPILRTHPDGATSADSESGCDIDGGFAFAGQQYRTEMNRESIMSFYRAAATTDGWRADDNPTPAPSTGPGVSAIGGCFLKKIDGSTARLIIWFPSNRDVPDAADFGRPGGAYGIDVSGRYDDDGEC
ncbi:hypothetical protein AB0C12_15755 [Actinoplanes sp. NPDC048967]|uniref:hypothetical protein n=1 Tax=Actinoplanes sp. NPDC048967 TaxID=3155269 RepID=UPI0033FA191B